MVFLLRMNKILLALDSFGGSRPQFPFDNFPIGQFPPCKGVYTKQSLLSLSEYARLRGIEVIPYFSSWGRVQYLRNMPGGVELFVDDLPSLEATYRNLDVANPETHKVMLGMQKEIINTLKPEGFCIAMDEINMGNTVTSKAAREKNWQVKDWYREALQINADFLRRENVKKMYIWGDMIEGKIPGRHPCHDLGTATIQEAIELLPEKDILTVFVGSYHLRNREIDDKNKRVEALCNAGYSVVGAPWYEPRALVHIARSIARNHGDGLLMCAWNSAGIYGEDVMPAEQIRGAALSSYYSWSPLAYTLDQFPFVPDAIMKGAVYWKQVSTPAGKTRSINISECLLQTKQLNQLLGLPTNGDTFFLTTEFANYRGVKPKVFSSKQGCGAVVVAPGQSTIVPIASKAKIVTFTHATSYLGIITDILYSDKRLRKILPGKYIIHYADGSNANIELAYRINVAAINDTTIGCQSDIGLLGTLGNSAFINLTTLTWANPHPEKILDSIEVCGKENFANLSLMLFGITIE